VPTAAAPADRFETGAPPLQQVVCALGDGLRRLVGGTAEDEIEAYRLYSSLVARAGADGERLSALEKARLVYVSGTDVAGRPALVVVGERVHACCATPAEREQVMLLLLRECAALTSAPFVVVFLATRMPHDSGPTFDFLRTLLSALPTGVHTNLHRFYLVHPSLKMRVAFAVLGLLLWGKVAFVEALAQLHNHFAPGQLWLPEACVSHDEVRPNPHRGGGDCCSRSKEVSMRRPLVPCAFAASQPLCCCCTLTHAYAPSTTAVVPAAR